MVDKESDMLGDMDAFEIGVGMCYEVIKNKKEG